MTNYYKILGVPDFASQDEIKKAFRKLSKKFHPDVNDGDEFFANKFRELKEAYDFLSDNAKRASLDRFLKSGSSHNSFDEELKRRQYEQQQREQRAKAEREKYEREYKEQKRREEEELKRKREEEIRAKAEREKNEQEDKDQKELSNHIIIYIVICFTLFGIFYNLMIDPITEKFQSEVDEEVIEEVIDSSYYIQSEVDEESYPNYEIEEYENIDLSTPSNDIDVSYDVQDYYTIGSTKEEVKHIQGPPTRINDYETLGEVWGYGLSTITFKNGKVSEYSDIQNKLFIDVLTDVEYSGMTTFTIGSSKAQVKRAQGTPTSIRKYEMMGEVWGYDLSTVTFKNGRVSEYSDIQKVLNVE